VQQTPERRFTFQTRSSDPAPPPSEDQAHELGLAAFVGYAYGRGNQPGSVSSTIVSPEYPEYLAGLLLP
jgi:hypothetical protein